MYYKDQMQRHLGKDTEVCPYVLRLEDAPYDVAFIREETGSLTPVFDDWIPYGGKGIKDVLGAKFEGKVEHWSGNRADTEQTLHSIGKLLQGYSKYAAINAATMQGYMVTGTTEDTEGNIHLQISVN